ncbi:MAG TPA: MFS transporter [Candidatus Dormibacteraeota bacterium]
MPALHPPERSQPAAVAVAAAPWRTLLSGDRGRLIAGMLVTEFTFAAQVLLMAAVMPAVLRDLGGVALYGWAFAASAVGALVAMPVANRLADRHGPRPLVVGGAAISILGLVVCALAPAMAVLVGGRLLVGAGSGAELTVALGAVARGIPTATRARVFTLLTAMWILPGLVGPPVGGILAGTVGWRWAFVAPIPLMLLAPLLMLPGLRATASPGASSAAIPLVPALLVAAAASALLTALTVSSWLSVPLAVAGVPVLVLALRRILPPGTLTASTAVGATIAMLFLINLGYFGGDVFVPLVLTAIGGRSVTEASLVVTLASLGWVAAAAWQSRVVMRRSARSLVRGGALLIALGCGGVIPAVVGATWSLPYLAWTVASVGMGLAYQTLWLNSSDAAAPGQEGDAIAAALLAETIALSLGPGLAGGVLAVAHSATGTLTTGLVGVFSLAMALALGGALLATRLPKAPGAPTREVVGLAPASPPGA